MVRPIIGVERWLPVTGFPYEVSDCGRVRRTTGGSNNAKPGRILKPHTDKNGYQIVALCADGKPLYKKVHRLVCEAFNGPPSEGQECRHLDGNASNNVPANLKWGTAKDNASDRKAHCTDCRGERHGQAVFTQEQANEIRFLHQEAQRGRQRVPRGFISELAGRYGVSRWAIANIVAGKGYLDG